MVVKGSAPRPDDFTAFNELGPLLEAVKSVLEFESFPMTARKIFLHAKKFNGLAPHVTIHGSFMTNNLRQDVGNSSTIQDILPISLLSPEFSHDIESNAGIKILLRERTSLLGRVKDLRNERHAPLFRGNDMELSNAPLKV